MTRIGRSQLQDELRELMNDRPYLDEYVNSIYDQLGEYPLYVDDISDEEYVRNPNVLYMTSESTFTHIFGPSGEDNMYYIVEPTLSEEDQKIAESVKSQMLRLSTSVDPPEDYGDFDDYFEQLFDNIVYESDNQSIVDRIINYSEPTYNLGEDQYRRVRYNLQRDISGLGPIEPLMLDEKNEDIHIIGHGGVYVDHAVYPMIETSAEWNSTNDLKSWIRNIGERIDNPVSDSTPIVDATLPDGSRVNIMYSEDVSGEGPSMTIRQGVEVPLSINQITKWGTLSPKLTAYLWLALENDQTIFVVGETASGKTTTLNSILTFIPRDSKIYSAEDTAEVLPPHKTWQQTLTREGSEDSSSDVDLFNLVEAALRARPNYVIVGEVRGAEAQMAFQAAQTGHPVLLTFHASDIKSMIQRMTGEPLNVPKTFIDNCNIALFQNRVKYGDDVVRRVTSVQEIERYSEEAGGIIAREAFSWNPRTDEIEFTGVNNSYIMEERVAELLGYEDSREIYDEIDRRAEIVERLIDADVLGYDDVNDAYATIQSDGVEALDMIQTGDLVDGDVL